MSMTAKKSPRKTGKDINKFQGVKIFLGAHNIYPCHCIKTYIAEIKLLQKVGGMYLAVSLGVAALSAALAWFRYYIKMRPGVLA